MLSGRYLTMRMSMRRFTRLSNGFSKNGRVGGAHRAEAGRSVGWMRMIWPSVIGIVLSLYTATAEPAQTSWVIEICHHFRRGEDRYYWIVIRPIFGNRFWLIPGMKLAVTDENQRTANLAQWLQENCW